MTLELETIDIGDAANDNNGDKGRDAFDKINDNFLLVAAAVEDADVKAYVVPITPLDGAVSIGDYDRWRMPYGFALTEVRASLETPDSGGDIDINITVDGTTIFDSGDILRIDSGEDTSVGGVSEPDVGGVLIVDNDWVKVIVDDAPSGGAAGLKVYLIGYVVSTTA